MARVHLVKKARKAILEAGINKGDSYYWWKFRFGLRQVSKTTPHRSQLTQSEFLQGVYGIEDRIAKITWEDTENGELESIIGDIETLRDECEDKLSNMPDALRESSAGSGELLQERIDTLEEWKSTLESIDTELNIEGETARLKEEGKTEEEIKEELESQKEGILEEIKDNSTYQ